MNQQLTALANDLERDQEILQRELDEIDLLLKQAASETERDESRRAQAEERVGQLEGARPHRPRTSPRHTRSC